MDRDTGDFKATSETSSSEVDEDARLDALLAALPPAPGIRHVDDEDDEDDARAMEDYAAGRCYSHAVVSKWLLTWGHDDYKPFPEWLKSSG